MQICMIMALLRTCLTGGLTPQSAIWNSWLLQTLGKMVNHLQDPLLRNTKIKMGKNCRPVWAKSDIFWLSFSCFVKIVWWCVERMKGKYWHWQHWDHIHIWHPPPDLQVSEKLPKHRKNTALKLRKGAVYWRYQYVRKSTFIHLYIHMLYHTLICHLHTFIIHISNQVSYIYHQYRLYQLFI